VIGYWRTDRRIVRDVFPDLRTAGLGLQQVSEEPQEYT
jgi:hypothetical protein